MYESCYLDAADNEVKSGACDVLEKDTIDLLWNSLPFHELIRFNIKLYSEIEAEMEI